MSKKRTRNSLDVLGGLDDLLGISETHSTTNSVPDDESDSSYSCYYYRDDPNSPLTVEEGRPAAPTIFPLKRQRLGYSTRSTPSSPTAPFGGGTTANTDATTTTATDSLGGDEIDLLRRKDEEMADMALFLAKAVGETGSVLSLRELVAFLEKVGITRAMLALKRGGTTEEFVHSLTLAHPSPALRVLLLHLLVEFLHCVDVVVFFQRSVIVFFVESLEPLTAATGNSVSTTFSPMRAAPHWSVRKKRTSSSAAASNNPSMPSPTDARCGNELLEERVHALCTSSSVEDLPSRTSGRSGATLSLKALLTLVFQYNRGLFSASPSGFSVPLTFASVGGLERLGAFLGDDDNATRAAALSLLEVVTASETLRRERTRLLQLVPILVRHLTTTPQSVQASVLKVLTNTTNLLPSALSETNTVAPFVAFLQRILQHPTVNDSGDADERETFALCCAINVVKYEAKEGTTAPPTFTRAFMQCAELLPTLANSMTGRYHCNDAAQLVLSGYAALLLGALSLVVVPDVEPPNLRVPVMAAVAAASRGTRIGKSTNRQPMRIVAAIIQEFLLFQSAAGTLTKEALVEMDTLVGRIRQHNHIAVTAAVESETAEKEAEEEEEVTLGDLL